MTPEQLVNRLKNGILLGDGAMGTMLGDALADVQCPEALNVHMPEKVKAVHEAYVAAGSGMIQTNTFGGNPLKLKAYGLEASLEKINEAAVRLAREAAGEQRLVAGGIGPTGKLLAPMGELSFDDAVACFHEQACVLAAAGCDLFLIETMSDIQEARAAVIGAKKAANLPVICTMTFDANARTLTGSDPEQAATVLEALGVSVLGANCGIGPEVMVEIIRRMRRVTSLPLMAQANAGLPVLREAQTYFEMTPDKMAAFINGMVDAGANVIGGCCGTTPDHLAAFRAITRTLKPVQVSERGITKLAGTQVTVMAGPGHPTPMIGENINPTARKAIKEAYLSEVYDPIVEEALRQQEAGASVIDVNAGVPGIQQVTVMPRILQRIQQTVPLPLSIDATDPEVTEAGLKVIRGKALINSANGETALLERMVDLAVTYGAALLCLTLDEKGIPEKAEGRLAVARQMVDTAIKRGMRREDILIDPLTLTAGAQQDLVMETLRALRMIREELGVKTILGVSNISHGLPARKPVNAAFLAMALEAGLDIPIINPREPLYRQTVAAADVLTGRDQKAGRYIKMAATAESQPGYQTQTTASTGKSDIGKISKPGTFAADSPTAKEAQTPAHRLHQKIVQGDAEGILPLVEALLAEGWNGLKIIEEVISPALGKVGDWYEDGTYFLPQLLMAAEATQEAFAAIKKALPGSDETSRGTIVMATVKGDIHDIGKNIVSVMMENHGFRVVDLGRDVPAETIVEAAQREGAHLIGLSALMTTTMQQMEQVAALLKTAGMAIPLMVGGAVLTQGYAESIGAVYAPDAVQAVKTAKRLLG
ncbi:homocysteine S-methyltransferase family protein [Anoxynatronum sibiricum]|uniref:Methionine synthase n=1 Tax=Anoxynatronum sibiricum TaxID=210623 RepID=A0ABU9VZX9_9CLOT